MTLLQSVHQEGGERFRIGQSLFVLKHGCGEDLAHGGTASLVLGEEGTGETLFVVLVYEFPPGVMSPSNAAAPSRMKPFRRRSTFEPNPGFVRLMWTRFTGAPWEDAWNSSGWFMGVIRTLSLLIGLHSDIRGSEKMSDKARQTTNTKGSASQSRCGYALGRGREWLPQGLYSVTWFLGH